jgi:hypothetical protein
MQKWEIKRLYVPTDVDIDGTQEDKETTLRTFSPNWGSEFKKAWSEADLLAADGWELIGIAEETKGNQMWWTPYPAQKCFGTGCSWTSGYFLVFKRPKA